MNKVIAILTSDWHLSHNAPVARSAEPDWYLAMDRPIQQIADLQIRHNKVPVVIAGDVFDRWNSPPELINYAISKFRSFDGPVFAIPGQHDLPNHRLDEIHRSAYWAMKLSGSFVHLEVDRSVIVGDRLCLHPFPWGCEVTPNRESDRERVHLAVVHEYIWKRGYGYPGADEGHLCSMYQDRLQGYDAAVFGDNHQGFTVKFPSGPNLINCGTLLRRKSDERHYSPRVGLLHDTGEITSWELRVEEDRWLDEGESVVREEGEIDTSKFVEELQRLGQDSLDFRAVLNRVMDAKGSIDEVREIVGSTI